MAAAYGAVRERERATFDKPNAKVRRSNFARRAEYILKYFGPAGLQRFLGGRPVAEDKPPPREST